MNAYELGQRIQWLRRVKHVNPETLARELHVPFEKLVALEQGLFSEVPDALLKVQALELHLRCADQNMSA